RRRHTRFSRDWSSDVCSSDLPALAGHQGDSRMLNRLLSTKPMEPAPHVDAGEPVEGSLQGEATLRRTLTARQLVLLGVGAVIGRSEERRVGKEGAARWPEERR